MTGSTLNLSPDGQWVSAYDARAGRVTVTPVGARGPMAVVNRARGENNVWTAVAPGGAAVAWKDGAAIVIHALPGVKPVASVRTGHGIDFRFSLGGRWLTEMGQGVFRVFDRADNYRVVARIPTARHFVADVAPDGLCAAVGGNGARGVVFDLDD